MQEDISGHVGQGGDKLDKDNDRAIDSPITMPTIIQDDGQQLQEILQLFKQSTASPISGSLLTTPLNKKDLVQKINEAEAIQKRESPRLKNKRVHGKTVVEMAQDLIAKKWGVVSDEEALDHLTLQQYIDIYKHPLSEEAMNAVITLTEVAAAKKKTKKKKQQAAMIIDAVKKPAKQLKLATAIKENKARTKKSKKTVSQVAA